MTTLLEVLESALDPTSSKNTKIENFDEITAHVLKHAKQALNLSLSTQEAFFIATTYRDYRTSEWNPRFGNKYTEMVEVPLDIEVGFLGCNPEGLHEYDEFECPACGRSLCWGCSVRKMDDNAGENIIECPCGYREDYSSFLKNKK